MEDTRRDTFDRIIGTIDGLPGVRKSKASTVVTVLPILGNAQTFVIQTYQDRDEGFTVFVQAISGEASYRIVLPPKVAQAMYRQREALIKTGRKVRGRERWERMDPDQREAAVARLQRKSAS